MQALGQSLRSRPCASRRSGPTGCAPTTPRSSSTRSSSGTTRARRRRRAVARAASTPSRRSPRTDQPHGGPRHTWPRRPRPARRAAGPARGGPLAAHRAAGRRRPRACTSPSSGPTPPTRARSPARCGSIRPGLRVQLVPGAREPGGTWPQPPYLAGAGPCPRGRRVQRGLPLRRTPTAASTSTAATAVPLQAGRGVGGPLPERSRQRRDLGPRRHHDPRRERRPPEPGAARRPRPPRPDAPATRDTKLWGHTLGCEHRRGPVRHRGHPQRCAGLRGRPGAHRPQPGRVAAAGRERCGP